MSDRRLRVRCMCGRVVIVPPDTGQNEAAYVDCDHCSFGPDADLLIRSRLSVAAGHPQSIARIAESLKRGGRRRRYVADLRRSRPA